MSTATTVTHLRLVHSVPQIPMSSTTVLCPTKGCRFRAGASSTDQAFAKLAAHVAVFHSTAQPQEAA